LSLVARGPQRRSRTIGRSTRPIEETARTAEITGFTASNPLIRKRRCLSVALTTQRSGAHHTSGYDLEEYKTFLDRKKMPPPTALVPQDVCRGKHHRANPPEDDEQMGEINMIFRGSMSIASNTQGKKLEREISLAQRIEPERMMRWSDVDISFGPHDHPDTELSDQNLPFVVNLPIRRHKVAMTLIDNGASLNLIMRKTLIEMGLNLKDLTSVHDMFHGTIPG
jgi:hypothetical protein